jgi:uncharacterized protein YhfF
MAVVRQSSRSHVEKHRFIDVPWEFAQDEGEGFRSVEHWGTGHRSYYEQERLDDSDEAFSMCFVSDH